MNQEAKKNTTQGGKQGAKSSSAVSEAALKASLTAISGGSSSSSESKKPAVKATKDNAYDDKAAFSSSAFLGGFEDIQKAGEQALEQSREAIEGFLNSAGASDWADANNAAAEAVTESLEIVGDVAQLIGQELSELSSSIAASQMKAFEQFLGCKTASELFELQSSLIQKNLDQGFNRFSNIADHCLDLSKAAEPISRSAQEISEKIVDTFSKGGK